jgi:hypothetical protein
MEKENLKQRDFKTLKRIQIAQKSSNILKDFFEKGFKSFEALSAIVKNYYPEISETKLWDFWHFRIIDEEIADMIIDVFEKLKTE